MAHPVLLYFQVEMGLTWIDHDTIEKPIEEITLGTEEAVDIEFTVETLKSNAPNELTHKKSIAKKVSSKVFEIENIGRWTDVNFTSWVKLRC